MDIFLQYFKVGSFTSVIIAVLLLILPQIRKKYSAVLSYVLWLIIAVRLIVPFSVELPEKAVPIQIEISQPSFIESDSYMESAIPKTENYENGSHVSDLTATQKPAFSISPLQVITTVWLCGTVFLMLRYFYLALSLKKYLEENSMHPDKRITDIYSACTEGRHSPPIFICKGIESPMLSGIFPTRLYLPDENFSKQELEMIFAHELGHYRHKDLFYKLMLFTAVSIHWFNPLVWIMQKKAHNAIEVFCDSQTVKDRDISYRKAYSYTILKGAEKTLRNTGAMTTCFVSGKENLKMRISEILNIKKRKNGLPLIGLVLAVTALSTSLVACTPKAEKIDINAMSEKAPLWAKALSVRDGKLRYDMMTEDCKIKFEEEQKSVTGDENNFVIGDSSPFVTGYSVEYGSDFAFIKYTMQDSIPKEYEMYEALKFVNNGETALIDDYICSDIIGYRALIIEGELPEQIVNLVMSNFKDAFNEIEIKNIQFGNISHYEEPSEDSESGEPLIDHTYNFVFTVNGRKPFPKSIDGIKDFDTLKAEYALVSSGTECNFKYTAPKGINDIYDESCVSSSFEILPHDVMDYGEAKGIEYKGNYSLSSDESKNLYFRVKNLDPENVVAISINGGTEKIVHAGETGEINAPISKTKQDYEFRVYPPNGGNIHINYMITD